MSNMADSMAQASGMVVPQEMAGWKTKVAAGLAILLGAFWLLAGGWKATSPYEFAAMSTQLKVPSTISLPFASLLATGELLGGIMLLIPSLRRWGAIFTGMLLAGFMVYMGVNYAELKGVDCSCFKWLERTVSPEFFWSDGAMLLMTAVAGWWSAPGLNMKKVAMIGAGVAVFAGTSLAYNVSRQTGTPAPASVTVDGKPYPIGLGKVLVFFFDPQCMHCFHSAQEMAKYKFVKGVKIVMAPVRVPDMSKGFLEDTGLKANAVTSDTAKLRETFHVTADAPNGVAIENGRVKATWMVFDDSQPKTGLKELGWTE
jgi:uncharacterized membrane protein YphA (DoxX/SURF4 family)